MTRQLSDAYQILESANAEDALTLALRHKPRCILLDFNLPGYSGPDLCRMLSSISATSFIPIVVISAAPTAVFRDHCLNLGAVDFFTKPIDLPKLRERLAELVNRKIDRRREGRFRILLPLVLSGLDARGIPFEAQTKTENISVHGFRCSGEFDLQIDMVIQVFIVTGQERSPVGNARVAHVQSGEGPIRSYGLEFVQQAGPWPIRKGKL